MGERALSIGNWWRGSTSWRLEFVRLVIANLGRGFIMDVEFLANDGVKIWKREK